MIQNTHFGKYSRLNITFFFFTKPFFHLTYKAQILKCQIPKYKKPYKNCAKIKSSKTGIVIKKFLVCNKKVYETQPEWWGKTAMLPSQLFDLILLMLKLRCTGFSMSTGSDKIEMYKIESASWLTVNKHSMDWQLDSPASDLFPLSCLWFPLV